MIERYIVAYTIGQLNISRYYCIFLSVSTALIMADLSPYRLMAVALILLATGTIGFHYIEGMIADDAGGSPWINAFYCSAITLTT